MSLYTFEYKLPKKYYLKVIPNFEDTNLTRAFLYKGRGILSKLVDVKDYHDDIEKLEIVNETIKFAIMLEEQKRSLGR